jgi:hypothetical protein
MKYVIRYAALAMAMLSGTAFLSGILRLLRAYDFTQHRFAPVRVSPSETLFVGLTCVAFARIYQLMVGSKSDPVTKTQTEIDLAHVGFIGAWFCCLFMVHKMNLPRRDVSAGVLVAFVFTAVCVVAAGFVMRKKLFAQSAESLPGDLGKALRFWRGAHFTSFSNAMSMTILGAVLKFLGSGWNVAGIFFGLGLGFLLLWRPRQMAATSAQPA